MVGDEARSAMDGPRSARVDEELRDSAMYEAIADVDRFYRAMRASVPHLERPAAEHGTLTPEQAEAVARYRAAEARLERLRRDATAYSYMT
jgi:hypothetical protein